MQGFDLESAFRQQYPHFFNNDGSTKLYHPDGKVVSTEEARLVGGIRPADMSGPVTDNDLQAGFRRQYPHFFNSDGSVKVTAPGALDAVSVNELDYVRSGNPGQHRPQLQHPQQQFPQQQQFAPQQQQFNPQQQMFTNSLQQQQPMQAHMFPQQQFANNNIQPQYTQQLQHNNGFQHIHNPVHHHQQAPMQQQMPVQHPAPQLVPQPPITAATVRTESGVQAKVEDNVHKPHVRFGVAQIIATPETPTSNASLDTARLPATVASPPPPPAAPLTKPLIAIPERPSAASLNKSFDISKALRDQFGA